MSTNDPILEMKRRWGALTLTERRQVFKLFGLSEADTNMGLFAALQCAAEAESDNDAVDRFAAAMKEKLAKKRAEGASGWRQRSFKEHISAMRCSSDPVDIANYACFLFHQGIRLDNSL